MKKISYFFIVFVLIVGCVKGQNKENLNNLRDSLDKMVLEGTLRNDWKSHTNLTHPVKVF